MIRLVYGPPGAGKSTYVQEQQKPGDLVIDLDKIRASGVSEVTAKKLRGLMEDNARDHKDGDVWIVRTLADQKARAEFMDRIGVDDAHVLETDVETAKQRVRDRDGSDEKIPAIEKWWAEYTPDRGPETEEAVVADQEQSTTEGVETAEEQHKPAEKNEQGWPADTPVAEMTAEERANYWKHHSRRHEQTAKELRDLLEQAEQEQKPADSGPDPVEAARMEARREIFEARLDAAAAKYPDADFGELRKHLDMASFTGDDGKIDPERVDALFKSLPTGTKANREPEGWGNNQPYEGASGLDLGREMFAASHPKN